MDSSRRVVSIISPASPAAPPICVRLLLLPISLLLINVTGRCGNCLLHAEPRWGDLTADTFGEPLAETEVFA
jgi:hypothetical protein